MPVADEKGGELCLLEPNDYDPADLTQSQARTALAAWYLLIAAFVVIVSVVLLLTICVQADAMNLNITAHIVGQGSISSNYSGEWLNVSYQQNGSGIDISVVGGAA